MGIRYFQRRFARSGWYGLQPQSARIWRKVMEILGHRCLKCDKQPVTRDHIVPLSQGGLNHPSNLQPLCASCNGRKGNRIMDYRSREQREAILQRWPLRDYRGLACPAPDVMGEHACVDRTQCWEPCGVLGKSEEHVVTIDQSSVSEEASHE